MNKPLLCTEAEISSLVGRDLTHVRKKHMKKDFELSSTETQPLRCGLRHTREDTLSEARREVHLCPQAEAALV